MNSQRKTSEIFWLRPGVLAGRAGPDLVPWTVEELQASNIRRVLSVNDGALVHPEDFSPIGIEYGCYPLPDNAPPQPGDVEAAIDTLVAALEFVLAPKPQEGGVLVHCRSGKDRTGLFLCYYLVCIEGFTTERAIDEVKAVRPIALTAPGWDAFAREVLSAVPEL